MVIITDTREQLFLDFSKFKDVEVVRKKLDTGDYSVSGYESHLCIERKSVEDVVGTLIGGHSRFLRELERMKSYKERYILIEHSPSILFSYCQKHGWEYKFDTIIQSLLAYAYHYGVRVRFCKDREDMAKYIVRKSREFLSEEMSNLPSVHDSIPDNTKGN